MSQPSIAAKAALKAPQTATALRTRPEASALAVCELEFGIPGLPRFGTGLSFTLQPGSALALLGPNGAGKTTLLRTILGLVPPMAGKITIGERDLAAMTRREIAARVGYVPQNLSSAPHFRVDEWVLLGRLAPLPMFARPRSSDWLAVSEALGAVGMSALRARYVEELSGGEQRLVATARALAQGARTLVLDEPAAGLDYGHEIRLLARLDAMRALGFGIVFSTHDPRHALEHADAVLMLDGSGGARLGSPASVLTEDALAAIYGVAADL